jgi:hypothetical protein
MVPRREDVLPDGRRVARPRVAGRLFVVTMNKCVSSLESPERFVQHPTHPLTREIVLIHHLASRQVRNRRVPIKAHGSRTLASPLLLQHNQARTLIAPSRSKYLQFALSAADTDRFQPRKRECRGVSFEPGDGRKRAPIGRSIVQRFDRCTVLCRDDGRMLLMSSGPVELRA